MSEIVPDKKNLDQIIPAQKKGGGRVRRGPATEVVASMKDFEVEDIIDDIHPNINFPPYLIENIRSELAVPTDLTDFRRMVLELLLGLRSSLGPVTTRAKASTFEDFKDFGRELEGMRIAISAIPPEIVTSQDLDYTRTLIYDAETTGRHIIENHGPPIFEKRFRYTSSPGTSHAHRISALIDENILVGVAFATTMALITAFNASYVVQREFDFEADGSVNLAKLKEIVPDQKIAPVQFEVSNDQIRVVAKEAATSIADERNTLVARQTLIDGGRMVLSQLRQTNCDPRLVEVMQNLQETLETQADVVQLGMLNISCEALFDAYEQELSPAVAGLMKAHTFNMNMYLAQFTDWQRFTGNAAAISFSDEHIQGIIRTADQIVEKLRSHPQYADQQVPKTFEFLRALIKDPRTTSKNVVFALVRTIENLVASVFKYGIDFIEGSAKLASDHGKKVAAGILIAMAVNAATGLAPAASKLSDAKWVGQAAKIMQSQLDKLAAE